MAIFTGGPGLAGTRISSFLIYIGAKDDGSDGVNWSYNTCKAGITLSPPTNQQTNTQLFYRPDALPVAQPTVSKKNHKKLS